MEFLICLSFLNQKFSVSLVLLCFVCLIVVIDLQFIRLLDGLMHWFICKFAVVKSLQFSYFYHEIVLFNLEPTLVKKRKKLRANLSKNL